MLFLAKDFILVRKILVFKGFLFLVGAVFVFVILSFTKIITHILIFNRLYFQSSSMKIKACGMGRWGWCFCKKAAIKNIILLPDFVAFICFWVLKISELFLIG